eukprot:gene11865-15877_t
MVSSTIKISRRHGIIALLVCGVLYYLTFQLSVVIDWRTNNIYVPSQFDINSVNLAYTIRHSHHNNVLAVNKYGYSNMYSNEWMRMRMILNNEDNDDRIEDSKAVIFTKRKSPAKNDSLSSYNSILFKQEYELSVYLLALQHSIEIMSLPTSLMEYHIATLKNCIKNYDKNESMATNQHSLELRFPEKLVEMFEIAVFQNANNSDNDHNRNSNSNSDSKHSLEYENLFSFLWTKNSSSIQPLFHYIQSYPYLIVYCLPKMKSGRYKRENWIKGEEYLMKVAEYIVTTDEWKLNSGMNFISSASHPKTGPQRVVHPWFINQFVRQSFLRTDFDFSGYQPKDIIIPYYVPSNYHLFDKSRSSRSSRSKTKKDDDKSNKSIFIFFAGGNNPPGGLRKELEERFQEILKNRRYYNINVNIITNNNNNNNNNNSNNNDNNKTNEINIIKNIRSNSKLLSPDDKIIFTTTDIIKEETYYSYLLSADYCLSIRGDTASSKRLFSAIEAECIPVIISDWIILPYENIIDYSKFIIRFPESILHNIDILILHLKKITYQQKNNMKFALKKAKTLLLFEPSDHELFLLNPITLSLFEAFLHRKKYCDSLSLPLVSHMCSNLYQRLSLAVKQSQQ